MLKRTIPFLLMFFAVTAKAQINDTALSLVHYSFTYASDTTFPAETEDMVLFIGKNTSVYKSYYRVLSDSVMLEQVEKLKNTPIDQIRSISLGVPGMKRGSPNILFKDLNTGKMQRIEFLLKSYLIDEEAPVINWTVTEETKNIQELACQKATARFRGRNYTAWFCPQLPYSNGPWKLGGLPGLILEASDDEQQVVFKFSSFENIAHRKVPIALPATTIVKSTEKDFKQLRDLAENDPEGFSRARMAEMQSSGMSGGVSVGGLRVSNGAPAPRRKKLNNPIERSPQ